MPKNCPRSVRLQTVANPNQRGSKQGLDTLLGHQRSMANTLVTTSQFNSKMDEMKNILLSMEQKHEAEKKLMERKHRVEIDLYRNLVKEFLKDRDTSKSSHSDVSQRLNDIPAVEFKEPQQLSISTGSENTASRTNAVGSAAGSCAVSNPSSMKPKQLRAVAQSKCSFMITQFRI